MPQVILAAAQANPKVGDIPGNTDKVLELSQQALQQGADVIVFPELMLTGYPPEDLLLRPSIRLRVDQAINKLCDANLDIAIVVGYPKRTDEGRLYNAAGVILNGELTGEYLKQALPNYQVFDEERYFEAGTQASVFDHKGVTFGLTICEDIWQSGPAHLAKQAGADIILTLNASPFHRGKQQERESVVAKRCAETGCPVFYVNQVGGQDELVFDGGSFTSIGGEVVARSAAFDEQLSLVALNNDSGSWVTDADIAGYQEDLESVYNALVVATRDYVNKNGFKGIVLGLSGGVDSALTLAVATDALGKDRVHAVMMPFKYTSQMSLEDAEEEAKHLDINYQVIPIEPMYNAFVSSLSGEFEGLPMDATEENIQARCRGTLLMAISNKKGLLVLTTGNKSEMAVGYSTLYGDMAGGYDVLKDVEKSLVFDLCWYRNTLGYVIPERVITRPPSAELRPDQVDEDSLPPYEVLDEVLRYYVEQDMSAEEIIAKGFDKEMVMRIIRLVDLNEYKRRQAPIGARITARGFGRDRRYPVTSGWKAGV